MYVCGCLQLVAIVQYWQWCHLNIVQTISAISSFLDTIYMFVHFFICNKCGASCSILLVLYSTVTLFKYMLNFQTVFSQFLLHLLHHIRFLIVIVTGQASSCDREQLNFKLLRGVKSYVIRLPPHKTTRTEIHFQSAE